MVVTYIVASILGIALGALALALGLWIMDDKASLSELSEDFRTCLVYSVVMQLVGLVVHGITVGTGSFLVALLGLLVYVVLAFKLLMDWFDMGLLGVILLMLVALFVQYFFITAGYTFIRGLIG